MRHLCATIVVLATLAPPIAPAHGDITYNTIALSGEAGVSLGVGPGLGPDTYFQAFPFTFPVINAHGHVAFQAYTNNLIGLWSYVDGNLAPVALVGNDDNMGPQLGANVTYSNSLRNLNLSNTGSVLFSADVTGNGVNNANRSGIWMSLGGSPSLFARDGNHPQNQYVLADEVFESLNNTPAAVGGNGQAAFRAYLIDLGSSNTRHSLWKYASGTLTAIAIQGADAPESMVGIGVVFGGFSHPSVNQQGQVAFTSSISGAGVEASNNTALWVSTQDSLEMLIREGTIYEITSSGNSPVFFRTIYSPSINNTGRVAVRAIAAFQDADSDYHTQDSVWTIANNHLNLVAAAGDVGPDPGLGDNVKFVTFSNPVLNKTGHVAFTAGIAGDGVNITNHQGIWTNIAGSLSAIARIGDNPLGPNLGAGVYFVNFSQVPHGPDDLNEYLTEPLINSRGDIVFQGHIAGNGVGPTNDSGIWAWVNGELFTVIREGDLFDVNPDPLIEDWRTISGRIVGSGSGGEDGQPVALNDDGLLVFKLEFEDGSSGVFTALIPESGSLAILAPLTLMLARRRCHGGADRRA